MICKMKVVLLALSLLRHCLALPSMEDNKLPSDQELMGQPEEVASLGLPSDEESFNRLSVFFTPAKPSGGAGVGSGTYHFVSSTFPEVDARGFHESVFDGIGDYFPSWPAPYKRADHYSLNPSLAQRLGLQPRSNLRKRSEPRMDHPAVRKKRFIQLENSTEETEVDNGIQPNYLLGIYTTHIPIDEDKGVPKRFSKRELAETPPDKRSGRRYGRGMEMGSSGFHGDIFSRDFGDFITMRKRARGAMGFHGDTFSDGFGDFATMKRSLRKKKLLSKLKEYLSTMTGSNEVHSDKENREESVANEDESYNEDVSSDMAKRRPEMTSMGFHGDTFSRGFGEFDPFKKRRPEMDSMGFHGDTFTRGFGEFHPYKKRLAMASTGFHGDTFSQGFGDFATYKKRRPEMDSMGFHGDTFSRGFGDFDPFKKRRPEMDSMGFHGDTFTRGFGEFDPYKKRLAMASSGFHGDTFSQGFGDFSTYKKRRPEMTSMGFHGDTFSRGFGEFDPYKKRRPEMDSMGFHGDTFSRGFGDFDTFKKRRPEMDSMGFHGDTFNRGFGEFDMYKKSSRTSSREDADEMKTEGKQCCSVSSIQRH